MGSGCGARSTIGALVMSDGALTNVRCVLKSLEEVHALSNWAGICERSRGQEPAQEDSPLGMQHDRKFRDGNDKANGILNRIRWEAL